MKILTRTVMIVAGIVAVLFFCFWKADDAMRNGELFERHVVPGKPDLEIRIFGFVDAGFSAWLDTGWRKKKIFDSLECYAPDFLESTNPIVRSFQGTIVQRERDRNLMPPMFAVLWSADAQRVGIAFKGYFVAAYDRATGEKLQFADYLQDMHVKGRDGSELWHDYQQCDADIERFLREEPGRTK